ncbi:MAG: hypothetical protein JRD68_13630 [Deltaproteobacteria bacterium]|nr:hypothetical protein [Deltaproteobacteria bacterium]
MSSDNAKAKKTVLIGLDGAAPLMVKRFMDEGELPHLKNVVAMGSTAEPWFQ